MALLRTRLSEFWFKPVLPDNLGMCRILFFGALFFLYLRYDFRAWTQVSKAFWEPIWFFARFRVPLVPGNVMGVIQLIWKFSLALSCIGLFTRVSTIVSFLLSPYLFGIPHSFGKIHHFDAILVFILLVMALARCGDAWSADHLIQTVRRRNQGAREPAIANGEYRWPVRMVWFLMSLIFFTAGVSKLRHSGLAWVTSETMGILLVQHQYHIANTDPLTKLGLYLAQQSLLPHLLAAGSLTLEVGYPLALFWRSARWYFVLGAALMQIGIRILLGPSFEQHLICNVFWIPWDRVAARFTGRASSNFQPDRLDEDHYGERLYVCENRILH
jgi:vitamin K-dependent gamma-carboxylase-like protein